MELTDRPFGELPAALVEELLRHTEHLSREFSNNFAQVVKNRDEWRKIIKYKNLIRRDNDLTYSTHIPTTCGVDGSYAMERLLASDLVAATAVAVEGLTPPSETRHWPEPRHLVWVQVEAHEADTGTILRALMIGMELELAVQAPQEIVFLDGSFTTPLIYFNQALNKVETTKNLNTTKRFLEQCPKFLKTYSDILTSTRTDRSWLALPKYTTRREIGQEMQWPDKYDDRGLLSLLLEAGEYTSPRPLQQPAQPWHLNPTPLATGGTGRDVESATQSIVAALSNIQVVYYRPFPWLPALRIEMSRAVAENKARLASALSGIRHQCGAPAMMEPYPLYMADRMVKHLSTTIPTLRQVTSQHVAKTHQDNINEVFMALHGYRTESGV